MRDRQGMGGLWRVLHPKCDIHGTGRTPAGGKDARAVHRLDERNVNGTSGRALRSEIIRDGQRAEQLERIPVRVGRFLPPAARSAQTMSNLMQFDGDKIAHMTKIWNAGMALKDLGWA